MSIISFKSGHLELYYGPMCSGKTLKLKVRLSEYADIGISTCYINSSSDIRQGHDSSYSTNCSIFRPNTANTPDIIKNFKLDNLRDAYCYPDFKNYTVIGIDESQLFGDLVELVKEWINDNKIVIVAGLNSNFKMEKYGNILDLIPMSDHSEHMTAHCKACLIKGISMGAKHPIVNNAPFTLRLSDDISETIIGGTQLYAPVCRYHYKELINLTPEQRYSSITHS